MFAARPLEPCPVDDAACRQMTATGKQHKFCRLAKRVAQADPLRFLAPDQQRRGIEFPSPYKRVGVLNISIRRPEVEMSVWRRDLRNVERANGLERHAVIGQRIMAALNLAADDIRSGIEMPWRINHDATIRIVRQIRRDRHQAEAKPNDRDERAPGFLPFIRNEFRLTLTSQRATKQSKIKNCLIEKVIITIRTFIPSPSFF